MRTYTIKNAIVDIGFIDGCLQEHLQGDAEWQKHTKQALDCLFDHVALEGLGVPLTVYYLGVIRGALWSKPTPEMYTEAMDRLTEFFVEGEVDWYQLPQPWRPRTKNPLLSDQQRDAANAAYTCEGIEIASEETGLTAEVIEQIVHPKCREDVERTALAKKRQQPVADSTIAESSEGPHEPAVTTAGRGEATGSSAPQTSLVNTFSPSGNRGRREWTPEQRAAQAERARNQHKNKPPFDNDLEAVKADWEAGLPFDRIGDKYNCSGSHIRNFLKKHGVNPNRGRQPRKDTPPAQDSGTPEQGESGVCQAVVKPDVPQMPTDTPYAGKRDPGGNGGLVSR